MKKRLSILLAVMMILSLAACGEIAPPGKPNGIENPGTTSVIGSSQTGGPGSGESGKKIYYSYYAADHSSLNLLDNVDADCGTFAEYCMSYLYRSYPDENGSNYHYIPDLASDMPGKMDGEGYVWQIPLREDACWSNGEPIDADTWMFTFEQALNPLLAMRMSSFLSNNEIHIRNAEEYAAGNAELTFADVGIKKIDKYTLELTLAEPADEKAICKHFNSRNNTPVYKPLWEDCLSADGTETSYGSDIDSIMCCGPYNLTEWSYDSIQVYTRNPDHWLAGLFHYDEVQYRIVPEMNARIELWEQGLLDILKPDANTLEIYLSDPRLVNYGSTTVYHIDINAENPNNPLCGSDNYRKAIYHAINRELIADRFFGHMQPAGWYVSEQAGLFSAGGLTYRDSQYGNEVETMVASWSENGHSTGYNEDLALDYFNKACEECGVAQEEVITIIAAFDASETNWKLTFEFLKDELPRIFNNRVQVEIRNYSGISTTAYKQQGVDGWDLSPNGWSRSVSRIYPYQCFYYFLSTYSNSPNNYFNKDFEDQFAYCDSIKAGDYDTLLAETKKLEELYLEHVIQCPVVQERVYELHSDKLVLPVVTYVPGIGWGAAYGDKLTSSEIN